MLTKAVILMAVSFSSLLMAFLAAAAVLRAKAGGRTGAFAGLCASAFIYSVCYLLELISPDLETMLLVIRVEYLGIVLIPPFFLMVVRDFLDDGQFRVPLPLLFVVPIMVFGLVLTMDLHDLYYIDPGIEKIAGLSIIRFDKGPGYWAQNAYLNLAIACGVFVFFKNSRSGPRPKRIQARFMLIGCFLPWVGSLLYLAGAMPAGMDPSPLTLSVTGAFFGIGFFRYHLFDLRPVARDTVFEQMRDAVLVTDDLGTIVDHNTAAGGIFPSLGKSHILQSVYALVPDSPSFTEAMIHKQVDSIVSLSLPEGERRYALHHSMLSDRLGSSLGIAHVFMDVTERVELEEKLTVLASTDELTGIANRRSFFERARTELERARRYGRPFGVAILDLNDFKGINDTYGHPAGDEALCLAAHLCAETLRSADIMGRYGGDEFAFAFPECDETGALEAAERLAHIVASAALPYGEKLIRLSASVGAAGASSPPMPDLEDMLKLADERMYKQKGRRAPGGKIPDEPKGKK